MWTFIKKFFQKSKKIQKTQKTVEKTLSLVTQYPVFYYSGEICSVQNTGAMLNWKTMNDKWQFLQWQATKEEWRNLEEACYKSNVPCLHSLGIFLEAKRIHNY